jgi:hypothetical protein
MEPDQAGAMARRLAFITARGLPWTQDPLALREAAMLQQRETEDALQVELAKKAAAEPAVAAAIDQEKDFDLRLDLVKPDEV